jgi:hypothetical protein
LASLRFDDLPVLLAASVNCWLATEPDDQNPKGVSESVPNAPDGLEAMMVELFG